MGRCKVCVPLSSANCQLDQHSLTINDFHPRLVNSSRSSTADARPPLVEYVHRHSFPQATPSATYATNNQPLRFPNPRSATSPDTSGSAVSQCAGLGHTPRSHQPCAAPRATNVQEVRASNMLLPAYAYSPVPRGLL